MGNWVVESWEESFRGRALQKARWRPYYKLTWARKGWQPINNCGFLLDSENITKSILLSNPLPPSYNYGLPKVHKEGAPLRPVVFYIVPPTYRLAKFLDEWFKLRIDFRFQFSITNSLSLVANIKDVVPLPNQFLVSFDVVSLFPHIDHTAFVYFSLI